MLAHEAIIQVIQGQDPRSVVNELVTSANSLATKIPKPMGMVKKTRKKDELVTEAKSMLGYKVMNYKDGKAVSGADSRQSILLKNGSIARMPGAGIWLSLDKNYVKDYYAVHDQNVLLTFEFNPSDVIKGNLTDKETEFSVSKAKLVSYDIIENKVESLLERAYEWLLERKRAATLIMYHGTSTKFLRSILKQGLIPNPKMRVWKDDEAAMRQAGQESRKALDGIYFASNFMTAVSAGGNAYRKFGGTYLFVAAQLQPRHAYADEDTIKIKLEKAIVGVLGYSDNYSRHWFERVGNNDWNVKGQEVANRLSSLLTMSALPFGLGSKGAKVPPDPKGCTLALRGMIEKAAAVEASIDPDFIKGHAFRTGWKNAGFNASEEERQAVVDKLTKELPSAKEAEQRWLKGLDLLTRRYKGLAMLSSDDDGGIPGWFTHTVRMPEPVTYKGRNKILAVFQTQKIGNTNYIVQHYGTVTPKMISDMKRSSWLSAENDKIIKPTEAKKLGIEGV